LGNRVRSTALRAGGERLGGVEFGSMTSEYAYILLLAQSETERLLAERVSALGVTVERGVEFVDLSQGDDVHVVVRNRDGHTETIVASYVIAADGSHSPVRKALGLTFEGRSLAQTYVLGDVHLTSDVSADQPPVAPLAPEHSPVAPLAQDQLSIFLASNGFLAVFPMGGGRFRFMATDPEGITGDADDPTLADVQALYDRIAHVPARCHVLAWSSRFRINSRHMATLRSGRVFFGGDAAHVHSPAGGQGMNAGIQDMINLCWKLAMVHRGRARPELLDTYGSDRLPVIRQLVSTTLRATKAFNSTNPIVHGLLVRAAPKLLQRTRVQNMAAPRLGQIAASYRGAPLAQGGGRLGALRAGDRVPDLHLPEGRLYDLLDPGSPTLLIAAADDDLRHVCEPWAGVLPIHRVTLPPSIAAGPVWLLVRPDGYLAAAGGPADARRLGRWLGRWLEPVPTEKTTTVAAPAR
jgi:2-polyprenyl-6-methoxyphenol hydroxylase-like FAD-dependent oxidoreductase